MYYLWKKATGLARRAVGVRTYPARYDALYDEIRRRGPRTVLEIGTNDGRNAVRMGRAARAAGRPMAYVGLDLFEGQDEEWFRRESSLRTRSRAEVLAYLRRSGLPSARLFAGDSTRLLPVLLPELPPIDLAFIDGGHSLATVEADWRNVQPALAPGAAVFFDDYPNWGVGPVVDGIDRGTWDVEVLPTTDRFRAGPGAPPSGDGWLRFQMARVRRKA